MTALSDLLNNLNRREFSSRQIATEAEKRGHKLNFATASRYLRGDHPAKPSAPVLAAFAAVFGTDVNKIREAAGQAVAHDRFELPAEADTLDPDERRAITELVRVMARQKKAGEGNAGSPTPMNDAGGKPATGEDDGLGAFGHRDRGNLDHEDLNDGNGDNVYSLVPPPPAKDTAAYRAPNRGKKQKDKQDEDAEGSQDPGDDDE
ncbi:hypothetical protein CXR25_14085 [Brevibacterium aurantiacum]|uniref:hypothetical protein n=1 Tax=Brevibacterium aurantiacum TaxID=273384 RepID=UPI000F64CD92|nr:hypothetical protein [Brevibacterium aurantiacum]AZL13825.1 hypothetical protein CXR25_14085 [Brevibacterium aurantiacum]